jgi:hypothetical protein
MSNSPLVSYTRLSPNCGKPRNHAIDTISIHCTAGNKNNTAQQIADLSRFTTYDVENGASCNYAVGGDGSIALVVDEANRSWCTSSRANDNRAITIEVASNVTGTEVNEKAYSALIDLLVDICQRNGIKKLLWKADKSLIGQVDQQNMTVHRWFANKACPGEWLYSRHGQIAAEVNSRLEGEEVTQEQFNAMMNTYLAGLGEKEPGEWSVEARTWAEEQGLIQGDENGKKKYKQSCTREQMVVFLHRFFKLFCK